MTDTQKISITSYVLAAAGLIAILGLNLLPTLLAGLLVYHAVEFGARPLNRRGVPPIVSKLILLTLVAAAFIFGFAMLASSTFSRVADGQENLPTLVQKMADVVATARSHLPLWMLEHMPANMGEWQTAGAAWLRNNASQFSRAGIGLGIFFIHLIIGMVIGGMVALHTPYDTKGAPLTSALAERATALARAFRRIVFSQVRISALNTALTSLFIIFIMPALGYPLPLVKTMIVITFVAGLLPIIGNLISNTIFFLIGLSVSPIAAFYALGYLVFIHKLEYFINARIIGTQIRSRAWEILICMVLMEVAFGIAGLVAAPIYYAYLKDELSAKKLI